MRQRRVVQALSVTVLGFALACAPMALASASSHKTNHHHKTKHHHTTKTVAKGGLNPGSSLCVTISNAESNSGNVGTDLEKAMEQGIASGNYASVKQAMLTELNLSLKDEGPAESALSSAPANVQAAMKGIFSFVGSYKTLIENSTSITQLGTSMASLAGTSKVEADSLTLANYVTAQCGTTTTTTATIP